jgi:K+-sensing histidine kinase KdpD
MLLRIFVPAKPGSVAVRFGFAAVCCAIAFLARLLLDPVLRDRSPLLLFALAVALSAIRGGFGPGLFSVLLGAFGAPYFFPPLGSYFHVEPGYRVTAALQLVLFVIVGVILSWLSGQLRSHELRRARRCGSATPLWNTCGC